MGLSDILKILEKSRSCDIVTSFGEIPIKMRLPVRWVSIQERFVSLDFKECKFRNVFSSENPVYIKVGETYLLSKVFSNIRDELVLEVDSIVPPPSITMREFIRVQPSEKKPVFVSICLEGECIHKTRAKDVSETGISIILKKEDAEKFLGMIEKNAAEQLIHKEVSLLIELPDGYNFSAIGELKNILTETENLYVRLGFRLKLKGKDMTQLRSYIMKRQREIIEQWRIL